MTAQDFDWGDDADSVVIRSQPAIALYTNPRGDFVLRQEGQYHPDEDQFICVAPENLEPLGLALINAARNVQVETEKPVKQRRSSNGKGETETPLLAYGQPETVGGTA